ncbi:Hypothetical_protein [Hexamita inflata]|uniref:Hypothetical_protein n=1 Tax=Hexamita inflata TaxID=28002 RepID=A0AA86RK06_9EUKA|nr:Hypothetical protein HINF_LOCUS65727 [Hexamita inflata]
MGQNDSSILSALVVNYTNESDSCEDSQFAPFSADLFSSVLNQFDALFDFSRVSYVYSELDMQVEHAVDLLALGQQLSTITNLLTFKQLFFLKVRFNQKYVLKQQFKSKSQDPLLRGVVGALNEGQMFKDVVKQFNISRNELQFVSV